MDTLIEDRAKLSLDFDESQEELEPTREEITRKVEEISEKSGFLSRAPSSSAKEPSTEPQPGAGTSRPRRTRALTGRTHNFSTKIKPEAYERICELSAIATEEEDRPVSMAEIVERGIEALERDRRKEEEGGRPLSHI